MTTPAVPQSPPTFADMRRRGQARPGPTMYNSQVPDDPEELRRKEAAAAGQAQPQGPNVHPQAERPPVDPRTFSMGGDAGSRNPNSPTDASGRPMYRGGSDGPAQPPPGGGTPPGGAPNIEGFLSGKAFNFQGLGPFSGQPYQGANINFNPVNAPTPGNFNMDPTQFQNPGGNVSPAMIGKFTGASPGRVGGAQEQSIFDFLQNPSAYDDQVGMNLFNRLKGDVDASFNQNRTKIGEEMARRGIDASTIHGGRLGDLTIEHDRTLGNLATDVATDRARTFGTDRANSLASALGYRDQNFGEGLSAFNANAGATQANNAAQINAGQLNLANRSNDFSNAFNANAFNAGRDDNLFNRALQLSGHNLEGQLAAGGFNRDSQAQGFNQNLAGYNANANTNAQNHGQQMDWLNSLLGYGQQQFNNQVTTQGVNNDIDQQEIQNWLAQLGLL